MRNTVNISIQKLLADRGQREPIECLDHLMAHKHKGQKMSFWLHLGLFYMKDTKGMWPYNNHMPLPQEAQILRDHGMRASDGYFLIANNHPNLDLVYEGSIWEDGLWKYALLGIPDAIRMRPRFFHGAGNQWSTKLPAELIHRYLD